MKSLMITLLLFCTTYSNAQPVVQPLSSGDYWRIKEYNQKLRDFQYQSYMQSPVVNLRYQSGSVTITELDANRLIGSNEVSWYASPGTNISSFVIEYSRNNRDFERAGHVGFLARKDGDRYFFRHPFQDENRVFYRVGVVNNNGMIVAYSPAVQLRDEAHTVKVFPTLVRTGQIYLQLGEPYEKMQVLNSAGQIVYEKGINQLTGLISIQLPALAPGAYFVRLLSDQQHQHVQKIMVDK